MTTGLVTAITTDWRGDTLEAATLATDTVLQVSSTVDFDEDGGWLVVADSAPMQYVTVDENADTITLAAAVGAVYEFGAPVNIWDPTVANGGAQVVEYVATVELHDGTGTPSAVIPHATIPVSGVDYLLGASVRIEQTDDGEWYLTEVLGREAQLVGGLVAMPIKTAESGQRVEIETANTGGRVAFFTGSPNEDPTTPGFVSGTSNDLGGGVEILQLGISGPKATGAASAPTLGLNTIKNGSTYERIFAVNSDKLTFNGDRVETTNLYLTAHPTTSAAANANIGPGGQIRESTSSERFKTDLEPATIDPAAVLKIVVQTWRDKAEVEANPDTTNRYLGVTAEQLHNLGLVEVVRYDDDGLPYAVDYDRLFALVLVAVQAQEKRISRLEAAAGF